MLSKFCLSSISPVARFVNLQKSVRTSVTLTVTITVFLLHNILKKQIAASDFEKSIVAVCSAKF